MALFACAGMASAAAVELGEITIGQDYTIGDYDSVTGTFTAPSSGTLVQEGVPSISLYTDADYSTELPGTFKGYSNNGRQLTHYTVEEGKTYYLYCNFVWAGGIVTWYMDGIVAQPLSIQYMNPEDGETFNFANYEALSLTFNQDVTAGQKATISYNGGSAEVNITVNKNVVTVPVYGTIQPLLKNGTLNPGDPFSVTLKALKNESGAFCTEPAADGEGNVTFNFLCGSLPVKCVNQVLPAKILSYFNPGSTEALLSMTFDGELSIGPNTRLTLGYGNLEGEDGEYYYEEIIPTLSEDKKTLTADLSGKLRTPQTMTPLYASTTYSTMDVRMIAVVDQFGNPVASEGQGTIGSYSWSIPYEEIQKSTIIAEFTPANGSSLTGAENISVYLSPVNTFSFTGFNISYLDGEETKSVVVAKDQATVSGVTATEANYTFAIPAEVKGKKHVTVTLAGLQSTDGYDHSEDVKATYDAFVIISADPANGSKMATLDKGTVLTIQTNYDALYPDMYIVYEIEDMNPDDPTQAVIKSESWLNRQEDGTYSATVYGNYKLYSGHTYHVNFTAWASENDKNYREPAIGQTYITWEGATAPYVYSDIELSEMVPAADSTVNKDLTEISLTFTGMVNLDPSTTFINLGMGSTQAFASLDAIDSQEANGKTYSNEWKLVLPDGFMKTLTAALDISFKAVDMEGRCVKGNMGSEENTYFYYTFDNEDSYADFDIVADGTEPFTSVASFTASSSRGIGISYLVSDAEVKVYSLDRQEVAHVASTEMGEGELGQKNLSMKLILDTPITEPGAYVLMIPQNYFVIDEEFSAQNSAAKEYTFTIESSGEEPGEVNVTLDPAAGNVTALSSITFTFVDEDTAGPGSGHATISKDGETYDLPDAEYGIGWNEMIQKVTFGGQETEESIPDGSYTLTFPKGYFMLGDDGRECPELVYNYIVGEESAINGIAADEDGIFRVYNIAGVKVLESASKEDLRKLSDGIYIANGVKVLIRK